MSSQAARHQTQALGKKHSRKPHTQQKGKSANSAQLCAILMYWLHTHHTHAFHPSIHKRNIHTQISNKWMTAVFSPIHMNIIMCAHKFRIRFSCVCVITAHWEESDHRATKARTVRTDLTDIKKDYRTSLTTFSVHQHATQIINHLPGWPAPIIRRRRAASHDQDTGERLH